ncbi:triose-phosphate isomerase [Sphingomonas sp.]|jgi:triosephosphate isomerase|uniref:triose-phosphate isomerase n=1 Tax=Sphingomonas sp. TaxID=28214 RepID=UPI0025F09E3A|nr:triose-phosphate isomerase [Sphingomonas sp.]
MANRKLVAGNWKMHGTADSIAEIVRIAAAVPAGVDVALCLPATLIERAARAVPGFAIGGQDVHGEAKGAFTGDLAAHQLHDAGARLVIVGHSERRDGHRESDGQVRAKAISAMAAALDVILCVGESFAEREAGRAVATVSAQLDASLPPAAPDAVAYEPIWAIGTGRIPSLEDIGEMHSALRGRLVALYGEAGVAVRLLYGGSVKPSNAAEIFGVADVDGALVGGASLTAADFLPIVVAAANS